VPLPLVAGSGLRPQGAACGRMARTPITTDAGVAFAPHPDLRDVPQVVPGAALAQDSEPGEIRLHRGVVAGAVRVPTAASFDEGCTDLHRVGAFGIPAVRAV